MNRAQAFLVILGTILQITTFAPTTAQLDDPMLKEKANGAAVVTATLRKIKQSCIFADDFYFTRRVAWVESHFGNDLGTFERASRRGIWQLSNQAFNSTKISNNLPNTQQMQLFFIYNEIYAKLGINYPSVTYKDCDMNKPIYNALAVMIYLNTTSIPIPPTAFDQAVFWYNKFSIKPDASVFNFIHEIEKMPQCKSAGLDLVLIIDGSFVITSAGFDQIKQILYQFVESMEIGPNSANVAIIEFSDRVTKYISLANTELQNKSHLLDIVINLKYTGGWTRNTHLALESARHEFEIARDIKLGFARQIILLTGGISSNTYSTKVEIERLRALLWLEVYSIGIGTAFNSGAALEEITNIASYPKCTHLMTIPALPQISLLQNELHDAICFASAPLCINSLSNCSMSSGTISGRINPGVVRYFTSEAYRNIGRSFRISTERFTIRLYVSAIFENPSEGLYNFRTEARPGSPASLFVSPQFLQNITISGTNILKLFVAVETDEVEGSTTENAEFKLDYDQGEKYISNGGENTLPPRSNFLLLAVLSIAIIHILKKK